MGKAARIACIFTPMALTIASFVCLALIEVAGWHTNTLPSFYFLRANLTDLNASGGSNSELVTAIGDIKSTVAQNYQVYLWNYCESTTTTTNLDHCTARKSDFVFDPLSVWGLEIANNTASTSGENIIQSTETDISNYEDELLGKSGKDALNAYKKVAKWMFIAYQVSFWTTLGTIVVGILAIFSRWGGLLTWILAFVSSFFTLAAVLTSTVLFEVLTGALNKTLKDYGITLHMGNAALRTAWLGVLFSWAATLFWLFSVCCCSGRSNPHHKSNKGGLWNAEPKNQGYNDPRSRGLQVEKTGGGGAGYQRVSDPYGGFHEGDQVPLQDYAQPPAGFHSHQGAGYEPYRHA